MGPWSHIPLACVVCSIRAMWSYIKGDDDRRLIRVQHSKPCQGLPNGKPCPYKRKGTNELVVNNHNMLFVCPDCSLAHDNVRNGIPYLGNDGTTANSDVSGSASRSLRSNANSDSATSPSTSSAPDGLCLFDPVLAYICYRNFGTWDKYIKIIFKIESRLKQSLGRELKPPVCGPISQV